ncbi:MAG TPA: phage holin family protein [Herbaspirillum sp.]|jgi:uncharacterized membrane protein YqjE|nr:phage holin family protein [Herbaspirillum sp.]
MEQPKIGQDSATGLIGGAFGLAKNLLGLIISRLELAALEFSEIGGNLLKIAVLFALALMAGWFALAYWSVLIVLLAWDSWGWKILLLMALVFTILTIALALYVSAFLRQGKIALPDTMAELRKDRDALL